MSLKKYALGIDIGGIAIKYGICSEDGELHHQNSVSSPSDSEDEVMLGKLVRIIQESLEKSKINKIDISAIGIGSPGCIDADKGLLKGNTPNFKYWNNVAIKDYLKAHFSIPIFLDNDANIMAFGEYTFGAGKGSRNVVCVTLGTGIGGGIVLNGEIYRGSFFAGAELGHLTISYNGRACNCGGIGCWERYGSASAMIQDYNEINRNNKVSGTREIFQRFQEGELTAGTVVEQTARYIAAGLASIINVFNPEKIIIGGGLGEAGEEFFGLIRKRAFEISMVSSSENVKIVPAFLGNRAGLLGAAAYSLKMIEKSKS